MTPASAEFIKVLQNSEIPLGPALFYSYNEWLVDDIGKLVPAASGVSKK